MANALKRNLHVGEEVVFPPEGFGPRTPGEGQAGRVFVCEGGFGLSRVTTGTALFGHWKATGERDRTHALLICPEETAQWQAEHPEALLAKRPTGPNAAPAEASLVRDLGLCPLRPGCIRPPDHPGYCRNRDGGALWPEPAGQPQDMDQPQEEGQPQEGAARC